MLGAVIGFTDKDLEYDVASNIKLTSDGVDYIQIEGENFENRIVSTDKSELPEGSTDENEKYSKLQEQIMEGVVKYYYIVAVDKVGSYDFYNLTTYGYNDDNAIIVTTK